MAAAASTTAAPSRKPALNPSTKAALAYIFLPARARDEEPALLPAVDVPEDQSLAPAIVD